MEIPAEPLFTSKRQNQYHCMEPEIRIMKTSQNDFPQCYNPQIMVEGSAN